MVKLHFFEQCLRKCNFIITAGSSQYLDCHYFQCIQIYSSKSQGVEVIEHVFWHSMKFLDKLDHEDLAHAIIYNFFYYSLSRD